MSDLTEDNNVLENEGCGDMDICNHILENGGYDLDDSYIVDAYPNF